MTMPERKQSTGTMRCTARRRGKGLYMEEKVYKIMGGAGAMNIVLGVVALVAGVASGVLLIISGGRLLAGRTRILF